MAIIYRCLPTCDNNVCHDITNPVGRRRAMSKYKRRLPMAAFNYGSPRSRGYFLTTRASIGCVAAENKTVPAHRPSLLGAMTQIGGFPTRERTIRLRNIVADGDSKRTNCAHDDWNTNISVFLFVIFFFC